MPDEKPFCWQTVVRKRVMVLAAAFALWVTAIEARLVYLQVFQRAELQSEANKSHKQKVAVPARRGEILDRHGRVLAYSIDADTIFAVPSVIGDAASTVSKLCAALGNCTPGEREKLVARLSQRTHFAFVRRQVSAAERDRVAELKLNGILFQKDPLRAYPNAELAASLLGYVGTGDRGEADSKGLAGIEQAYDRQIAGTPGEMIVQVDARNNAIRGDGTPPTNGQTFELTIDEILQHIAERELEAGVAENHAAGGCVVIMDPFTGGILAMANVPTFDPNLSRRSDGQERRNRCVQDIYEPGSTFKIVTASAALEEGVARPDDPIDVSAGRIQIGSRVVTDTHRMGVLSFTDVVVNSSNVGAIKVGLRIGAERLGRYVHRYGFGTRLSPDFRGENAGIVWNPASWNESTLASVSMGYEIGVTALQMATAVSAVANGGLLVQPRVVGAVIRGNVRTEVPHRQIRRAIAPATAAQLTAIMEGVVDRGTATAAKLPGYTIAGKTGTAEKLVNGVYSKRDYNSSFVGFLPSRAPVVTIIVMIDSPHAGKFYGGAVAAPIFKRIAEASMQYFGVGPSINPPPVVLAARSSAAPEIRTASPMASSAVLLGPPAAGGDGSGLPDLRGLGLREAIRLLARLGATPRVTGTGVVIAQDPPAGTPLEPGVTCRLVLGRAPVQLAVNGPHP